MKMIVGLGNPGRKYQNTPHNIGFEVIDEFAARNSLTWKTSKRVEAEVAEGSVAGVSCLLLKPTTFMNLSGNAVHPLIWGKNIPIETDLLVLSDDVDLPLGRLRMRPTGSAGGHRGLESIIQRLGSKNFARLRCGVAPDKELDPHLVSRREVDLADFVLAHWPPSCRERLQSMTLRAVDACENWLTRPLADVMKDVNTN